MLLTADVVPAVPGVLPAPRALPTDCTIVSKSELVREGEALVGALNTILKGNTEQNMAGPLAITCIRAAMTLIQKRPQFLGRVLPTLLALSKSSSFAAGEDGGEGGGTEHSQSSAAATALKAALLAAYESTHAMAQAWKKKVGEALTRLGAPPPPLAAAAEQQQENGSRQ